MAEILEFQVNPQSALKALADINAGITNSESKFTGANTKLQDAFTKVSDTLIKLTDRQYTANERLVKSIEARAAAEGRSNVDRLVQQRDALIKKLGTEETQIQRVTAAYKKLIDAESGSGGNKFQAFGETIKKFVENPLQASGTAATGMLEKIGPVGVGLAGGAVAAVAVGTAVFEMTKRFAESSESLVNLSAATGIGINDLDRLQAMAKLTGTDIGTLARAGTAMAQTLDEGGEKGAKLTEALARIHVSTVNFNGSQKEEGALLVETLTRLSQVTDTTQRLALAAETLGPRTSKAIQPLLLDYDALKAKVEELGYGQEEGIIKKGSEAAQAMHLLGEAVDQVERYVGAGAVGFLEYGEKAIEALAPLKPFLVDITEALVPLTALMNAYEKYQDAKIEKFKESPEYQNTKRMMDLYFQYQKTLEDVSKAQATVSAQRFSNSLGGTEDAIKQDIKDQEKKRTDALAIINAAKAGAGPGLDAEKKAEQEVRSADYVLASDKKRLEIMEQQKEVAKALVKLQTDAALKLGNPYYGQLPAQKKLLTISEMPGVSPADVQKATTILAPELNKELQDLLQFGRAQQIEMARKTVAEMDKQQAAGFPKEDKEFAAEQERQRKQLEQQFALTSKTYSFGQQMDQSQAEGQIRVAETLDPSKDARYKAEVQLLAVKKQFADEAYQHEMEMAQIQYTNADELEDAKTELRIKHAQEVSNLEIQLAETVAQEQRKKFDEVKAESEKLYETLFTHPSQFGKQLSTTLREAATKPLVEGLSNMTASVVTGAKKNQTPIELNNTALQGNNDLTSINNTLLAQLNGLLAGRGGGSPGHALSGGGSSAIFSIPTSSVRSSSIGIPFFGGAGGSSSGGFSGGGFSLGSALIGAGALSPSVDSSISFGGEYTGDISGFGGSTAGAVASSSGGLGFGVPGFDSGGIATPSFSGAGIPGLSSGGYSSSGTGSFGGALGGVAGIAKALGIGSSSSGSSQGQGGKSGGGIGLGSFSGILKNLKGTNWGGFTHSGTPGTDLGIDPDTGEDLGGTPGDSSGGSITGVNGVAGAGLQMGGMFLAQQGLLGNNRGTGAGILEGTAGGAMIGLQMGGPIGAAVGAAVGAGIGVGEMLAGVESPVNEVKRIAKQTYHVSVSTSFANNLVQLANSKYAKNITIMMQSPEVRQMLELYAAGTGQKMPASATPHGGSLVEQNGQLSQQATYTYGQAYTFQSSLPVAGGIPTTNYSYPGSNNSQPMSLSLNINGQGAGQFLQGQVDPDFVQAQFASSQNYSNGRLDNSALIQNPGLTIS